MTYQNDIILVCCVFVIFANFKLFKSIQKKLPSLTSSKSHDIVLRLFLT